MNFEHKEYIEQFLGIHDEDEQRELEQVYAMAEALLEIDKAVQVATEKMGHIKSTEKRRAHTQQTLGYLTAGILLDKKREWRMKGWTK
ncbi:hypothetical protein [Salinicoccus roseus]|uniref:hypothetical protein n=1 Tax=Salinicoccus roseus TaxID=45670 RepID=UPI002301BD4E|nr:hypothetical protein [Salinicoccus roseus]